uniref:Poly [ADP-ribose] polymerase n=1 Tax=Ascaris suum TaxID=6253 RepID=F1KXC7_ASCSU
MMETDDTLNEEAIDVKPLDSNNAPESVNTITNIGIPESGSSLPEISDNNIAVFWEYELSKGKWIRFNKAITDKLNTPGDEKFIEIEVDESKLQIDRYAMKQRNLTSGYVRAVRCVTKLANEDDAYVWEYADGRRRWRSVDSDSSVKLELAYKEGAPSVDLCISATNFTADLDNSVMKSADGGIVHKIRREMAKADAAMSASPAPAAIITRSMIKRKATTDEETSKKAELPTAEADKLVETIVNKRTKVETSNGDKAAKEGSKKTKQDAEEMKSKERKLSEMKSQVRKVLLKGGAAVDVECVEKVGVAHVYTEGSDVYDALLNQTNTQNNNNKFYVIQLLEDDDAKRYSVWFRWGRVGYKGQTSLVPCGSDLCKAKLLFTAKFSDKTRNEWSDRKHFRKAAGKYDYLPADYSKLVGEQEKHEEAKKKPMPPSRLAECVQRLLKMICDIRAMEEVVMELEYDATKAPLGKVTEEQIKAGYAALKRIENFIKKNDFSKGLVNAVNEYYTKIPHYFGMRQPPLIKTQEQIKVEISLLEALSDIEVAIRTLNVGEDDLTINTLDRHYANMKCALDVVESSDSRFEMVDKYLQTTHAATHNHYRMRICNLFAVNKEGENEKFVGSIGNRMLLWHGSRLTNWYGILSQGLRIAPPEAPVTGYMFGKGVYFADMSSKSANYCFPQKSKPGLLVLAEVALGNQEKLLNADYNADRLPAGKHSVMGLGAVGPDPSGNLTLEDGCVVPYGQPIALEANKAKGCTLNYNEYVVYDTNQIRIRYLVEVDFIFDF